MYPALIGFKSKKAAQLSAYFANKNGGRIEKLKLIKLIYLAERLFIERYGQPMLYDELYSLKHGPICSSTLNGINGRLNDDYWDKYLTREGREVFSPKSLDVEHLDQLSRAEREAADDTFESFGWMTASEIRNYTHKNCPEYQMVPDGRLPIDYRAVMEALNIPDAELLADEVNETRRIEYLLSA